MPPANDNFADAVELVGASGAVAGSLIGSSTEVDEPLFGSPIGTVWYHRAAGAAGPDVRFDVLDFDAGEGGSIQIAAFYADVPTPALSDLLLWDFSTLVLLNPAQEWWIQISAIDADVPSFTLRWPEPVPPPAPTVVSGVMFGTRATLTFDTPLDPGVVPATSEFGITVNGGAVIYSTSVAVTGSTVALTFDDPVLATDEVIAYYSGSGGLQSLDAVLVESFGYLLGFVAVIPAWKVRHENHAGDVLQKVAPENLHFVLREGALGIDEFDYEISQYAREENLEEDAIGDYAVTPDFVQAKVTDVVIERDGVEIMGGIVLEAPSGQATPDNLTDHVRVAGQGWLCWLAARLWPHNPDPDARFATWHFDDFGDTGASRYAATGTDVSDVVRDMLTAVLADANALDLTLDLDTTGHSINYEIDSPDTTFVYDRIKELSLAADDDGGFDFFVTWDKVFTLRAPRVGDPGSPVFTLHIVSDQLGANMLSVEYRNSGPQATHVLGLGAGTAERQGGVIAADLTAAATYRRWDAVGDFAGEPNAARVTALTAEQLVSLSAIVEDIPVVVDPNDIPNFWTLAKPGQYIEVIYTFGAGDQVWHNLSTVQRIVEMDCTVSTEGEETVAFTLNPPGTKPHKVVAQKDPEVTDEPATGGDNGSLAIGDELVGGVADQTSNVDRRLNWPTHPIKPEPPADAVETQFAFLPEDTTTGDDPASRPFFYRSAAWHRLATSNEIATAVDTAVSLPRVAVAATDSAVTHDTSYGFMPRHTTAAGFQNLSISHNDLAATITGDDNEFVHIPQGSYAVFAVVHYDFGVSDPEAEVVYGVLADGTPVPTAGPVASYPLHIQFINLAGLTDNVGSPSMIALPRFPPGTPFLNLFKSWAIADVGEGGTDLGFTFWGDGVDAGIDALIVRLATTEL